MEIDIRRYIIDNFRSESKSSIEKAIISSIKDKDEETLPGMGVLFEILWNGSNKELKTSILEILESFFK